jgi:hypothetical protein
VFIRLSQLNGVYFESRDSKASISLISYKLGKTIPDSRVSIHKEFFRKTIKVLKKAIEIIEHPTSRKGFGKTFKQKPNYRPEKKSEPIHTFIFIADRYKPDNTHRDDSYLVILEHFHYNSTFKLRSVILDENEIKELYRLLLIEVK